LVELGALSLEDETHRNLHPGRHWPAVGQGRAELPASDRPPGGLVENPVAAAFLNLEFNHLALFVHQDGEKHCAFEPQTPGKQWIAGRTVQAVARRGRTAGRGGLAWFVLAGRGWPGRGQRAGWDRPGRLLVGQGLGWRGRRWRKRRAGFARGRRRRKRGWGNLLPARGWLWPRRLWWGGFPGWQRCGLAGRRRLGSRPHPGRAGRFRPTGWRRGQGGGELDDHRPGAVQARLAHLAAAGQKQSMDQGGDQTGREQAVHGAGRLASRAMRLTPACWIWSSTWKSCW